MGSIGTPLMWSLFAAFVVVALLVDFFALSKQGAHRVSIREALIWSLIWVAVSGLFAAWLWWHLDTSPDPAMQAAANTKLLEFVTGYLVEKALAVDNVFVFLMVFTYFAVPAEFQKRVLMIGILAALLLRAVMILIGAWVIARFHWILYVFGAFLIFTGIKMWWATGQEPDLESNPALKWLRRRIHVAPDYDGEKFFTRVDGIRMATPLALVVVLIGIVDVIFAVDSIPAIFAITLVPFIVLTSNVPACDVFRAGGNARALPSALVRPCAGAAVHRHENAADRPVQDSGRRLARGDDRHSGHCDDSVADRSGRRTYWNCVPVRAQAAFGRGTSR